MTDQAISGAVARSSAPLAAVRVWLLFTAFLVFAMVIVGGATRLTESGLSITQWKPITGVLPPLSVAEWQAEFDRYRQIPQFSALNADMHLDGFKTIFWWEWAHRLLARVVGVAFIVPALAFGATGRLKGRTGARIGVAAALLALEPMVGWWMVSSGLSQRTEVAQERLALHLLIAAAVFGTLIYTSAGLSERRHAPVRAFVAPALWLAALAFAQLGLGALVAGLRAGLVYNTWPLMDGRLVPTGLFGLPPTFRSLWDDATTVQFDHRMGAYAVVILAMAQAVMAARTGGALARRAGIVAGAALAQAALGIATLIYVVPLHAALAHQAFALVLFGLVVAHASATRDEAR